MDHAQLAANIAAVLALALSLVNAWRSHIEEKERFSLSVVDYLDGHNVAQFFLGVSNLSAKPLVITGVTFRSVLCELEPKRIRNRPEDWNFVSTPRFPVCISSHSAAAVYLEFVGCARNSLAPGQQVSFRIQTSARSVWKTVPLGNTSHYLHIGR